MSCSLDAVPTEHDDDATPAPTSRARVMGLDAIEQRASYGAAVVALLLAAVFIPRLLKNTWITSTAKVGKNNVCPTSYTLVKNVCSKQLLTHPSYWLPQFLVFVIVGLLLGLFAWRRQRPVVIVASFLLGLATGVAGILFLALGTWLGIRAFRLNKYGDPTFKGSNVRAREKAQARREGRSTKSTSTKATSTVRTPAPSKRYTPKKSNRR